MQQVEEPVTLDVEYQVEFPRIFVRQSMAALDARCMQQNVDAPVALAQLLNHLSNCLGIREVDAEIVRRSARGSNRIDGGLRGLCSFQRGRFFFDERWSSALAAGLDSSEQIAFEILLVSNEALEIRIGGIRLRHQVEQVEDASRCGG